MNVTRSLLSINQFSRTGHKITSVKGIVIHYVGNPGTSAIRNRNYFESLKNQVDVLKPIFASAHFIVGLTGEIIQCIPVDEMAYHVGAKNYTSEAVEQLSDYPNNCTIGIELCHPDVSGKFTQETWCAAVELSAALCKQFDLSPLADIWTHNDITLKNCPKYFVDYPETFERFKLDVDIAAGA